MTNRTDTNPVTFKKATAAYKATIFSWLAEPHIQAFWDNTQAHKDDIINFIHGRKTPSDYCDGRYTYWIALSAGEPYAMLMTIQETPKEDIGDLKLAHLSETGHSYSLDYMIGNTAYIGKGYGALTIIKFVDFLRKSFDKKADTFLIDPACDNPRAKHVYEKAGFRYIADFIMGGDCSGSGKPHHLLIKKFPPMVSIALADDRDHPVIKSMAKLYQHDLSKVCSHLPIDESTSFDFKHYFEDSTRKVYLVYVYDDIAGFILLNQACYHADSDWHVGEFFILGKYQRAGIGKIVAEKIWQSHPGQWEIPVIPENTPALQFWDSTIGQFRNHVFAKENKQVDFDNEQPTRIIYTFISNPCG